MSLPEEVQRYEQQGVWRDFASPLGLLGIRLDWRVLDVGCGSGVATRLIAERAGHGRVVGLDLLPEHVAAARVLAEERGIGNVAFVAADAQRLPYQDGRFDLLWASFVVEYLASDAVAVLREFARVVRPGGVVAVFDVDGLMLHHDPLDPDLAGRIERWHEAVFSWGFDPEIGHKLPEVFREAGLHDVQARTFPDPELYPTGRPPEMILEAWERRLSGMRALRRVFGTEQEAERFRQDFLSLLRRPDRRTLGANWLVWGRVGDALQ